MNTTKNTTKETQEGAIPTKIRAWIVANITATTFTRRDVCRITKTVNNALELGMTGGIARVIVRNFVARVLKQRGQIIA